MNLRRTNSELRRIYIDNPSAVGKLIKIITKFSNPIDLEILAKGIYVVTLTNVTGVSYSTKIIK